MIIKKISLIVLLLLLISGCSSNSSDSDPTPITPEEPVEIEVVSVTIAGDTLEFVDLDNVETSPTETNVSANVEMVFADGFVYSIRIPYEALGIPGNDSYEFYMTSEEE
jgi:hypothetical protein